jgi:hypothetical protein
MCSSQRTYRLLLDKTRANRSLHRRQRLRVLLLLLLRMPRPTPLLPSLLLRNPPLHLALLRPPTLPLQAPVLHLHRQLALWT